MARYRVKQGNGSAADAGAPGDRFEVRDYLEHFSTLIEAGKTILDAGCGDGLPVDAYLVRHGFAVNGIDASPLMIERARENVPQGFYEVKDMLDLQEGEYCVDGVVSLRAMLSIARTHYGALLRSFASFMPSGGGLLLAMRSAEWVPDGAVGDDSATTLSSDGAADNTDLLEEAGFSVILNENAGPRGEEHQIIVARS